MDPFDQLENLSNQEQSAFEELLAKVKGSDDETLKFIKTVDTNLLMAFLRSRKLNVNSAFTKFSGFQRCRLQKYHHIFNIENPKDTLAKIDNFEVLKTTDHLGGQVIYVKIVSFIPNANTHDDILRQVGFAAIHFLWSKNAQLKGTSLILDCSDFTWTVLKSMPPSYVYCILDVFLSAIPWRINGVHHINSSYIHRTACNVFKSLCPKKLADRLHMHPTIKSLHEYFPKDTLPNFLGGIATDEDAIDFQIKHRFLNADAKTLNYYKQFISSNEFTKLI